METEKEAKQQLILYLIAGVLFLIILFSVIFYVRSTGPARQAEKEATAIARKYADLETVDQFYWFNRQKTYFTLLGKNKKKQAIAVIVPKDGKKVTLLAQKDGLSEKEAAATVKKAYPNERVQRAELGLYNDKPVWEVVTKASSKAVNYYLISFADGQEVKTIKNL